jgi:excisionase family DNA binding protein
VRRLIFERRIAFVKVGRHVRITPGDLDAYVAAGRVDALRRRAEAG